MKKNNGLFKKFLAFIKEFIRKFLVWFKKNPNMIPMIMHVVSFLVLSLNLTDISNTTSRIQGNNMGLCGFVSMLLSILSMICILNAFPKRQKPNYLMVGLLMLFFGLIIYADITYINCITNSTVKITPNTMFIYTAQNVLTTHIVLVAITAVTVLLEPFFAKLLKKINTSVELEETSIGNIDLVDEE